MTTDSYPQSLNWLPQPGTVLDGRYRLGEMVDSGGMGVIIRAEHLGMKREVAVKLLSPKVASRPGYRERFRREVDVIATLEHPNVVRCYDSGETENGALYLVMELLEGHSLKAVLKEEGSLGLKRTANIALQMLDGVASAHLKNVVHRDLKPGNIFLVQDLRGNEVVKVLDFGLAKSLASDDVRITRTGAICGTAAYVAPEALVTQETTAASDVYACGLVMLEMVLGRPVFGSDSMAQTFLQQLTLPAQIPRRVWDTEFGQLIARALQKHPARRPANAEVLFQELSAAIDAVPDVRLARSEVPSISHEALSGRLLQQLSEGGYGLEVLEDLPVPQPYDPALEAPGVPEPRGRRDALTRPPVSGVHSTEADFFATAEEPEKVSPVVFVVLAIGTFLCVGMAMKAFSNDEKPAAVQQIPEADVLEMTERALRGVPASERGGQQMAMPEPNPTKAGAQNIDFNKMRQGAGFEKMDEALTPAQQEALEAKMQQIEIQARKRGYGQ